MLVVPVVVAIELPLNVIGTLMPAVPAVAMVAARSRVHIFRYIFKSDYKFGGIARVEMNRFNGVVELFGASFEPVEIVHGEAMIHGFRFGSAAYLTDFSEIPAASKERLRGLDILFLDALRHRPHPTHSTVENSLKLVEELKPQRAFFT